jgi:hypothetical protein
MTVQAVQPRLGHAAARTAKSHIVRRQPQASPAVRLESRAASCAGSGALYTLPASSSVMDSAQKTTLSWNPDCLDDPSGKIDIYLYAPQEPTANLPIHAWAGIPASEGAYDVKLAPKWWNSTASVELSLNIVKAGNQPWDSANPFGPMWTATYTAPTDGSKPPADAIVGSDDSNALVSIFYKGGHLTSGGKAAAIICPLLVLFIGIGILIRKMHLNRNNKTADWAEHMDKRMSQISIDWMNGGDGSAGPVPGSRPASFLARPTSSFRPSLEAVRAYYNANINSTHEDGNNDANLGEMSEVGHYGSAAESMAHARSSNYRVSRVSFAPSSEAEARHSAYARHSRASMPRVGVDGGFRTSRNSNVMDRNSQAPSVPRVTSQLARDDSGIMADADDDADEDGKELIMSPVQEAGAKHVDFDALMRQAGDHDARNSVTSYPAAEMIRTNDLESVQASQSLEHAEDAYASGQEEEFEETSEEPAPLPSQTSGMRSLVNATSPDEAMMQYAMTRSASRAGATSRQDSTSRRGNGGGNILMRTLYRSNSSANTRQQTQTPPSHARDAPTRSNSDASSIRRKPVKRGSSMYIDP